MALLHNTPRTSDSRGIDLASLGVVFVAIVAIALTLVGVVNSGTSPLFILFPTLLGLWAIQGLRRR
jgi:hypothetical membrane protein